MVQTNQNDFSNIRFFSNSSLFKNASHDCPKNSEDPVPLGLSMQEPFKADPNSPANAGGTMGPSITNTYAGSDTCIDVDYEF